MRRLLASTSRWQQLLAVVASAGPLPVPVVAADAGATSVPSGSDTTSTPANPSHHAAQGKEYTRSGWQQPPRPGDPREPNAPIKGQPKKYENYSPAGLPIVEALKAKAPAVPPPITRDHPVHAVLDLTTTSETLPVSLMHKYNWWTYDGSVPGPIIRCRVGDVLEVRYKNIDQNGLGHNIDFHAVTGPGGGAPVTYAEAEDTKVATFKLLYPGVFLYHCAAAPVPVHIANGMYGLVIVEPEEGLPPVDKEFYVMQSEVYGEETEKGSDVLDHCYADGLAEKPMYVVLNGSQGALTEKTPLVADQGDRIRIFFGNAGPNLSSSFHVIGTIFDKVRGGHAEPVYREADLMSPPARGVSTTLVPSGGAVVVEIVLPVPGNYTLLDHSIFRIEKGAIGFLKVCLSYWECRAIVSLSTTEPAAKYGHVVITGELTSMIQGTTLAPAQAASCTTNGFANTIACNDMHPAPGSELNKTVDQ